jgi:hypothetical protein
MSIVNGFFKDNGLKASILGDLVAKVRKGLDASLVAIEDTPVRVHPLASIVVQALRMTQTLRLKLAESIMRAALSTSPTLDKVQLLRAYT